MTISRTFWMKFLSVVLIIIVVLENTETRVSIAVSLYRVTACGPFNLSKNDFISFLDRNIILLRSLMVAKIWESHTHTLGSTDLREKPEEMCEAKSNETLALLNVTL